MGGWPWGIRQSSACQLAAMDHPEFGYSTDAHRSACQTPHMEMIRTSAVGTALLRLAGRRPSSPPITAPAHVTSSTSTAPTSTPTEEPGPRAFLVYARAMDYGDRRMSTGTDDELLEIGYAACGVLKTHPAFGAAVQALLKATGEPTVEQAQSLVRESVLNLCPRQKNLLP